MFASVTHNETMINYNRVEEQFPEFNMTLLNQKFVLISFGTITSVSLIHVVRHAFLQCETKFMEQKVILNYSQLV